MTNTDEMDGFEARLGEIQLAEPPAELPAAIARARRLRRLARTALAAASVAAAAVTIIVVAGRLMPGGPPHVISVVPGRTPGQVDVQPSTFEPDPRSLMAFSRFVDRPGELMAALDRQSPTMWSDPNNGNHSLRWQGGWR